MVKKKVSRVRPKKKLGRVSRTQPKDRVVERAGFKFTLLNSKDVPLYIYRSALIVFHPTNDHDGTYHAVWPHGRLLTPPMYSSKNKASNISSIKRFITEREERGGKVLMFEGDRRIKVLVLEEPDRPAMRRGRLVAGKRARKKDEQLKIRFGYLVRPEIESRGYYSYNAYVEFDDNKKVELVSRGNIYICDDESDVSGLVELEDKAFRAQREYEIAKGALMGLSGCGHDLEYLATAKKQRARIAARQRRAKKRVVRKAGKKRANYR